MSDEQDKLRASLEAPKLFGRKKKAAADEPAPAEGAATDETVTSPPTTAAPTTEIEAEPDTEPTAVLPVLTEAEPAPAPEPEPIPVTPEPEPVPDVPEPDPVPVVPEPEPEPVVPEPDPVPVVPEPEPEPVVPEPEPEPEPVVPETVRASMAGPIEDAPVVPAREAQPPVRKTAPRPTPASPAATVLPKKASAKEPTTAGKALGVLGGIAAAVKKPVEQADADAVPLLTPYRAGAATGLVVGGAMVLLTWLSLRGCEAVRGTSSCGGGPGFVLLLITFVVCVYLGSALLRAFVIPDPGSSSFLAVGLVAVVALLFLINMITSWAMIIVIPLLTTAAYVASVWVTETFVDAGPE